MQNNMPQINIFCNDLTDILGQVYFQKFKEI